MQISSSSRIHHPLARVYSVYRDRLPDLTRFLPDIERIDVRSRVQVDGGVQLVNVWHACTPIPSVARPFVRPEMMSWEDHAHWSDMETLCRWRLVVPALRKQVQCSGQTVLTADGDGTRVALVGDLQIRLDEFPGMNRWMARHMGPQVEAFIVQLITPNLERVNHALASFLDETPTP